MYHIRAELCDTSESSANALANRRGLRIENHQREIHQNQETTEEFISQRNFGFSQISASRQPFLGSDIETLAECIDLQSGSQYGELGAPYRPF